MHIFWMVADIAGDLFDQLPRRQAPTYMHATRAGAEIEALRLAEKITREDGYDPELVILKVVARVKTLRSADLNVGAFAIEDAKEK